MELYFSTNLLNGRHSVPVYIRACRWRNITSFWKGILVWGYHIQCMSWFYALVNNCNARLPIFAGHQDFFANHPLETSWIRAINSKQIDLGGLRMVSGVALQDQDMEESKCEVRHAFDFHTSFEGLNDRDSWNYQVNFCWKTCFSWSFWSV